MADQPCRNPACKSYGKPHPNCRCYAMAEGGEVEHFCSKNKAHEKDCEYYAEGTPDTPVPAPSVDYTPPGKEEEPTWENTKPIDDTPTWENTKPIEEEPTWENTVGKYETAHQRLGTLAEGVAQGFAGPLATGTELALSKLGVPDLSAEDIKGRAEANPGLHGSGEVIGLAGSVILPVGKVALVAKGATKALELAKVAKATTLAAKVGTGILKGAVESAIYQGGDNATKAMLGQGNPGDGVGTILSDGVGAAGLIGGAFGGLGSAISKGLDVAANSKMGTQLHSLLAGIGEAAKGVAPENSLVRLTDEKAYERGVRWYENNIGAKALGVGFGAKTVYDAATSLQAGEPGEAAKKVATDIIEGMGAKFIVKRISGPAASLFLKALTNGEMNPRSLFRVIDYGNKLDSSTQKINKLTENVFKLGGQNLYEHDRYDKIKKWLDGYVSNGGINQNIDESMYDQNEQPQGFAEGGQVERKTPEKKPVPPIAQEDPIATNFPEHNIAMAAAKGRISNYLTSLKPQKDQAKLAFDAEPDQTRQTAAYHKALDAAVQPLGILEKIKKGTIQPDDIKNLNALYPELNTVLQKKLTERIIQSQLKKETPPREVRQGLSMLMGTPLSGAYMPQNIQAAQAVFKALPQNQPAPPTKTKKGTSTLTKSDQAFLTGGQALVGRSQRR